MIKHKHQQLFELMVEEFRSGAWPDGCKLPSQKELALRYSVSVNVVSQTIELLKQQIRDNLMQNGGSIIFIQEEQTILLLQMIVQRRLPLL